MKDVEVMAQPAGTGVPVKGRLVFMDNAVDSSTGTILLKGSFDNADGTLWPGQFVSVSVQLYVQKDALAIPAVAVLTGQQGSSVFVVDSAQTVAPRTVKVARTAGDIAVIESGLQAGERVVTDGQLAWCPAPMSRSRLSRCAVRRKRREHRRTLHPAPRHDDAGFGRRPDFRDHRLPAFAGERPAHRGLSHLSVSASLPGASPETMASAVATPLEKQFSTIPGLDVMTSSSGLGSTSITLQFTLSRNIDAAAADVQAAISQTLRQLPQGMLPPSYRKVDPSSSPIVYYALTSATMPLSTLDHYGQTFIGQRLSTVDGVAQVQVYGSQKYAVRIQLDPQKLQARKIGIDEVVDAINTGNVNLPTGILWGTDQTYTVESNGQLESAAAFRPLVIAYRNGAPVRLEDVGQVNDGVQSDKVASWFNGTRAIVLAVQRQPGTNTVAVTERVNQVMADLEKQLPAAVKVTKMFDRSEGIQQSVADVRFTLLLTIFLVILVIFLFLRNIPATIIPSLALPMSLDRHLRGDVPARLQSRQPVVDGADTCGGFRRGRRHRGAGKHRPPHRAGRATVRRGAQGGRRRSVSRSSR